MNVIEVARKVVTEHQAIYFRLGKTDGNYGPKDIKDFSARSPKGFTVLDATSANIILQVYANLNEQNKAKLASASIEKAALVCLQLAGK
jgi:hypothetical protein